MQLPFIKLQISGYFAEISKPHLDFAASSSIIIEISSLWCSKVLRSCDTLHCFAYPMLIFLISCFSFILVFSSSYTKSFLLMLDNKMRLFSPLFWVELLESLVSYVRKRGFVFGPSEIALLRPVKVMRNPASVEGVNVGDLGNVPLLDLPDLALDSILERLSAAELCRVAGVCTCLRAKCCSDHMWENRFERKWGRLIGNSAHREWQWHMASSRRKYLLRGGNQGGILGSIFGFLPFSFVRRPRLDYREELRRRLPPDSIMSLYVSLESGEFWFPAQVYNRENGHDGFMLSCYDAQLSYNAKRDTFCARYSPNGRRTIEENIAWSRVRAPPVDIPPYVLHVSDCLEELMPGDHFEIQWRRTKEYPYGWWYGVVGHLDSCSHGIHCICHESDTVILEFNQYAPDSRWRTMKVNRKTHREEGNDADGFYGGIRKIYNQEEISTWRTLWPTKVLN